MTSLSVLSLMMGADTGGVSISIRRAFQTVNPPGWTFRSLVSTLNYINYELDGLKWDKATIEGSWRAADVIHVHHDMIAVDRLRSGWKGYHLPPKRYVVEFHGTGYREDPAPHLAEMYRWQATGVVSTLDLWLLSPDDTEWLPCPINVDAMQARRQTIEDPVIRIAHAPTNRDIKSTGEFLAAIHRLQKEGYPVEAELIEHVTWAECLTRKATADIYFDQVLLGYGNNAIEAWGMGIPVVAGGADPTLDEMERRFGALPFHHATEGTIYEALRELVEDEGLRAKMAARGLEHVRRFHDERVVVEQLKRLYLRAAGMEEQVA